MHLRGRGSTYEELRSTFRWDLPDQFNIGTACADQQPATSVALIDVQPGDHVREITFGTLTELSNRLAHGLRALGVTPGDRVGVVLAQGLATSLAHLAVYKLGAVAVPMSVLFGSEALRYRMADCDMRAVVVDPAVLDRVVEASEGLDAQIVVVGDRASAPHHRLDDLIAQGASRFEAETTTIDTPALLIYTSGTTGSPKGALHGHRVLFGHLPGFTLMFDFFGFINDRMWTPADWAWIGALLNTVLPAWFHGRPVVASPRHRFDPQWAIDLMAAHRVRTAFLPPTALKLMRQSDVKPDSLALRSCMSGGEPLGREMLAWAQDRLRVTVNEIYGQTEANLVVGNSHTVWPVVPGSMGRPFPGHEVVVLGEDGMPAGRGSVGEIAVKAPDPVMFLKYWNDPDATATKFSGSWLLTGDLGSADDNGYFRFHARVDDVINSAGYRIGPGEVEDCLIQHPATAMAAVIGVPDEIRGQAVKAYLVLAEGVQASDALAKAIQEFVRTRLSAHEYPRMIEFVDELPLTTTGKIRRNVLREWHGTPQPRPLSDTGA